MDGGSGMTCRPPTATTTTSCWVPEASSCSTRSTFEASSALVPRGLSCTGRWMTTRSWSYAAAGGVLGPPSSVYDDAELELRGMAPQLKARAGALSAYLRETTRFTEYVHAVVVTWSSFPQREVAHDRCSYLAGAELVEWLLNQPQ